MSEEDDIFDTLEGTEAPETPHHTPTPIPKSHAERNYRMPGDEPRQQDTGTPKRTTEQEEQAAFFKSQKEENNKAPEPEDTQQSVAEPTPEPVSTPEADSPLPPTPVIDNDEFSEMVKKRLTLVESTLKDVVNIIPEKEMNIETLVKSNIELLLIDMQTIADDLNAADELLDEIGTMDMIEKIAYEEKHRGLNMALNYAKGFIQDDGGKSKMIKPIHKAIKDNLNKLNEKLKYSVEA